MLRRFWRPFGARAIHILYFFIPIIVICSCISISFSSENSQAPKDEGYNLQGHLETPGHAGFSQYTIDAQGSILTRGRENGYNYSDVLVIYNGNSGLSIKIAKYFQNARNVPELNMLNLTNISAVQTVSRTVFEDIRGQIEAHLDDNNLTDIINYFVTTKGVPLRVSGGSETNACLDNELTLIKGNYQGYIGNTRWLINPYFEDNEPFSKSKYDLYLVTRLTGFTWPEIKRLIDNATASAGVRGTFVLDEDATKGYSGGYGIGNVWIRDANTILTAKGEQTYYDNTDTFVTGQSNVMGYASWGSNDAHHRANRLQNPDFEASMLFPTNWDVLTDSGITDNVSVNKSVRYSYQNSLMINRTATSSNFSGVAQNFSLVPEVRYWLRGRVNITSKSGSGGAHLQMQVLDASDNILRIINSNIRTSVTNGWVTFSQRIYEPIPGAVKLRILAVLNQSSGVVFFDQITLFDIRPHNKWLPGAIAETFVSTGGRSFNYGTAYGQSLVADLIRDGVSGVKGYVYEPYLSAIAHPDILFDRFTDGYNLAESYYMASNFLGWMDVVVGDPKMAPYADVLPDLNISVHGIRLIPETPNEEQEITVNYTVTNLGKRTDDEFIIKAYQVYGNQEFEKFITQHSIDSIEGFGTIRQFEFKFIAETPGEIKLKIIIDPDNDYKEHKENNNLAEIEIYINNLPDAQDLSVSPDRVYRTEEFMVQVQGADIESLTADLTPILEAKAEPSGEWFEFENEQLVTQYNSSGDTWDFTIMSNTTMALGKYSLRISFIDDNNAVGKYYFLHRALEVLNNLPTMDEIIFDRTVVKRTEQIWARINVSDIETEFFELEVEAQYRFKPKDVQSTSGWQEVDYLQSSAKMNATFTDMEDFWLAMIEFDKGSKIGYYQFRARVIDIDLNASDWMYPEIDLAVLNNPPEVTNITFQGLSVYRTETLQIEVLGTDIEDEVRLSSLGCEIEYRPQNESGSGDGQWDINYLTVIEFDFFTDSWKTVFQPPKTAQIGNYSFRARIIDTDGNYSDWAYITDSILVMNNPPVAELSYTSMVIKEDEEITLNAEKSEDIEDSESDFEFYWELSDDEGPFIVTFNETFTFMIHQEGEYQVKLRVKDTDGATNWDELDLTVENVKPTAKIEVNIRNPQVNEMILFSAAGSSDTTSDIETLTFAWNFGDDSQEMGRTINHSFSQPQRFTVTLTVTDDDGESDQATMSIIVESKEKDGGTSETDDDYTGQYFMAGVAVIIVITLVLLFILMLKKKRKSDTTEEPPEMTTLEPLQLTPDQASEQRLEQPFKPPYAPEEPTGKPPTLAGPELGTIPSPEALAQEPSTTELPSTDKQALGTTETTTLPAQEMPTIETSQTPKLPPKTEEMPDTEKDTQTQGPAETESETEHKEVLPPQEVEEPSLDQENGSDSHDEKPEAKTENEEQ